MVRSPLLMKVGTTGRSSGAPGPRPHPGGGNRGRSASCRRWAIRSVGSGSAAGAVVTGGTDEDLAALLGLQRSQPTRLDRAARGRPRRSASSWRPTRRPCAGRWPRSIRSSSSVRSCASGFRLTSGSDAGRSSCTQDRRATAGRPRWTGRSSTPNRSGASPRCRPSRRWTPGRSGDAYLPDRRGAAAQEQPLQRTGGRRGARADPRGRRQGGRSDVRPGAARLPTPGRALGGSGRRCASRTASSRGPTPRSTSFVGSGPPTDHPAFARCSAERPLSVFDAHRGTAPPGEPGTIALRRHGAVLVRTGDGGVWVGHVRRCLQAEVRAVKLPATIALGDRLQDVPESLEPLGDPADQPGYREISYRRTGDVGVLSFDFYNGAMSTGQCRRLAAALRQRGRARHQGAGRPRRRGVLERHPPQRHRRRAAPGGGGMAQHQRHRRRVPGDHHLHQPARRDVVERQRRCGRRDAGARRGPRRCSATASCSTRTTRPWGCIGSEYWTYVLPRRVGGAQAEALTERVPADRRRPRRPDRPRRRGAPRPARRVRGRRCWTTPTGWRRERLRPPARGQAHAHASLTSCTGPWRRTGSRSWRR